MPKRNPQERGVARPFHRRHGHMGFPPAGGSNPAGQPGDLQPHEYRYLENARYYGPNRIGERPGQTRVTTEAMDGCPVGLIDVEGGSAFLLGSTQFEERLDRYYPEQTPDYQTPLLADDQPLPHVACASRQPTMPRRCFLAFGEKRLYFNNGNGKCYELVIPKTPTDPSALLELVKGIEVFDFATYSSGIVVEDVFERGTAEARVAPVAYLGTIDGKVYRWDTESLTEEATGLGGGTERLVMGLYQGEVYAWATDVLYRRNGGAWDISFPTLPGGMASFRASAMLQYGDMLVSLGLDETIAPQDVTGPGKILGFDGTTHTLLHTIPSQSPGFFFAANLVGDLAIFQGGLYYGWGGNTTLGGAWCGRTFDLVSFADDFRRVIDAEAPDPEVPALLSTDGELVVTARYGNDVQVWRFGGAADDDWSLIKDLEGIVISDSAPQDMVDL